MIIGITGIDGHLGNNIARFLLEKGYNIKGLVRNTPTSSLKGLNIEVIEGDLFIVESLDKLCQDIDVLIHLAAKVSIYPSEQELVYKTNIEGVNNIVEACKRNSVKKVIHFSSIHAHEAYGSDIPINENTSYINNERSAYGYSKSKGEQQMLSLRKLGVDLCIINPTSVIGPFDFKPSLQGKMFLDIYTGKMPFIVDAGFDWVDVRDIAYAVESIISKKVSNEKFIISGNWVKVEYIAQRVMHNKNSKYKGISFPIWMAKLGIPFISIFSKITGTPPLYTSESIKTLEEGSKSVEYNKANKLLGYIPRSIDESIDDSINWLINNNA